MSEKGAPFYEILPAMQEHIDAEVKRVMLNVSTKPQEVTMDTVKEYTVGPTTESKTVGLLIGDVPVLDDFGGEDPPHHFVKHSDCSFTYADGPDPKEQELEDLRAQVRYLTAELESTQRRLSEAEDGDVFRPAYNRMRENFQVSMNTIRGLEDLLHSTQRELEETRERLRAARAALRIA